MRDNLEWTLKEHLLEKVLKLFGKVTIDLFASRLNHKVERYYSYTVDTDSRGLVCFTKNWTKEIICAFPPFVIISRTLKKIEKDEAKGVIIIPHFTSQPWFSSLLRILIEDLLSLSKTNMSLYFTYRRKEPSTMLNVTLMSGNPILQKEYQKKLYHSSYILGEQVRKNDMKYTLVLSEMGNRSYATFCFPDLRISADVEK